MTEFAENTMKALLALALKHADFASLSFD